MVDLSMAPEALETVREAAEVDYVPPDRQVLLDTIENYDALWSHVDLKLDREIHKSIYSYCENRRMIALLEKLDHLAQFMRIVHFNREERARQNFEEHENIWRAMVARNESRMVELLEEHINNRRRCLLDHLHIMKTPNKAT